MPTISTFFGIVIRLYFEDHPPPHFHAIYGEHEAQFEIESLEVRAGSLPKRAKQLVREWAELHQSELRENWRKAVDHRQLDPIEPLE